MAGLCHKLLIHNVAHHLWALRSGKPPSACESYLAGRQDFSSPFGFVDGGSLGRGFGLGRDRPAPHRDLSSFLFFRHDEGFHS